MNSVKTLILLLFYVGTTWNVQAQNETTSKRPMIEVSGFAEQKVTPNQIFIEIVLLDRKEIEKTVAEQEIALKKAIVDLGISPEKLEASDLIANYTRVGWYKNEIVERSEFTLEVETTNMVMKVFKRLKELKIYNAQIVKVDHTERKNIKHTVKIQAIKNAKEKADDMLEAIGQKTGKASKIINQESVPNLRGNQMRLMGVVGNNNSSITRELPNLEFKKITIQHTVTAKFIIE